MSYQSTSIASLLPRINRDLFIPGIQRPYVWQPEQILRLFDSLMQRYPISSFLLWDLAPESRADWEIYRFVSDFRHGDIHNQHAQLGDDARITLVLDGQQRLTSLLIGLHGSYTVKQKHKRKNTSSAWTTHVLFIDLAHSPEPVDDDDAEPVDLRYRFEFFEESTRPGNNEHTLWFQVGHILSATDEASRDTLIQRWVDANLRLTPDRKQVARETLLRLWETFWRDDAIAYYTETSQSYDKVLDIFIRANDGGTKLSRSDLLMSVITLRWERFNARDETEALLDELTTISQPPRALEREFILRSCLFFCDLDFRFKLGNFSPANIARIESNWASVRAALLLAAKTLRAHGIYGETIAGHNVLMLVGYFVFRSNREREPAEFVVSDRDAELLRRWVIGLTFHGLFGQTTATFQVIRTAMRDALRHDTEFPYEALAAAVRNMGRAMDFDSTAIDKYCAHGETDRMGPALLSLLYGADLAALHRRPTSLVQARFLGTEYLRAAGMAEPLIAPTQQILGRLVLSVALTEREREDYYARDFEDWIATRPDEFFATHALPGDRSLYRLDRLLDLAAERKSLIAQTLRQAPDSTMLAPPQEVQDTGEAPEEPNDAEWGTTAERDQLAAIIARFGT